MRRKKKPYDRWSDEERDMIVRWHCDGMPYSHMI